MPMRRRGLRAFRRGRIRPWCRVLALVVALAALTVACFVHCRTVVYEYAKSNAAWTAQKTTDETVVRVIDEKKALCTDLIRVTYNNEQIVSNVLVDSAGITELKTAASVAVMNALSDATSVTVHIPLGTFLGLDWLSGWGPMITVPMSATQSVFTSISSTLDDVGINQSTYRVNIHVRVNLWIVTPAGYASVTVENDFPVTEMVLLGKVPDNLTEVYGDSQDTIGEIFDYGTIND